MSHLEVLEPELAAIVGPERFLFEVRTTAKLQHPHILPLFDSGGADGLQFHDRQDVSEAPDRRGRACG